MNVGLWDTLQDRRPPRVPATPDASRWPPKLAAPSPKCSLPRRAVGAARLRWPVRAGAAPGAGLKRGLAGFGPVRRAGGPRGGGCGRPGEHAGGGAGQVRAAARTGEREWGSCPSPRSPLSGCGWSAPLPAAARRWPAVRLNPEERRAMARLLVGAGHLSARQVADRLGVSERTVWRHCGKP